jgi:hypothetical protein
MIVPTYVLVSFLRNHLLSRVWAQQIHGWSLTVNSRQPLFIVVTVQDDRHTVVELAYVESKVRCQGSLI